MICVMRLCFVGMLNDSYLKCVMIGCVVLLYSVISVVSVMSNVVFVYVSMLGLMCSIVVSVFGM